MWNKSLIHYKPARILTLTDVAHSLQSVSYTCLWSKLIMHMYHICWQFLPFQPLHYDTQNQRPTKGHQGQDSRPAKEWNRLKTLVRRRHLSTWLLGNGRNIISVVLDLHASCMILPYGSLDHSNQEHAAMDWNLASPSAQEVLQFYNEHLNNSEKD